MSEQRFPKGATSLNRMRSLLSEADSGAMGWEDRLDAATELLAEAWDEGYAYWYDHDDVKPGDGDYGKGNPYRDTPA